MFKVGDRVKIPKTKSIGAPFRRSSTIRRAKQVGIEYLTISFIVRESQQDVYVIGDWHFLEQDLELYDPTEYYIGGIMDV